MLAYVFFKKNKLFTRLITRTEVFYSGGKAVGPQLGSQACFHPDDVQQRM